MNIKFYLSKLSICLVFTLMACGENESPIVDEKPQPPKTIKIMPMGDSLTEYNTPGFRGYLYKQLIDSAFNIDFVGTKSSVPALPNNGVGLDPDHSGCSSFVIGPGPSTVDNASWTLGHGNIYWHLDNGYSFMDKRPDIILLLIGTNDVINNSIEPGYDANVNGAIRLDSLISKIFRLSPKVRLLVSSIPPVKWNMSGFGAKFNSDIPAIVAKYKNAGKGCYFVDTRNENTWDASTDFTDADQVHPTATGNQKIARSYFKALAPVLKELGAQIKK